MKILFRIPSGAGGMVQGMALGELHKHLAYWRSRYGDRFTVDRDGYTVILTFDNDRYAVVFLLTFKPNREHWWRNARIID